MSGLPAPAVLELAAARERLAGYAATLGHEVMQPLSSLGTYLQLIEAQGGLAAPTDRWLAKALECHARCLAVVQSAVARTVPDWAAPTLGPVRLDDVLDGAIAVAASETADATVTVHRAPLPVVVGDAVMLGQVLTNLLANAVRHGRSADGSVEILVASRPAVGGGWWVEVADGGPGFGPAPQRLLAPGRRGADAAGRPGLGLGLSTVQALVADMGGRVRLASAPGGGALVALLLRDCGAPCPEGRP